jgi:hypothetical protein
LFTSVNPKIMLLEIERILLCSSWFSSMSSSEKYGIMQPGAPGTHRMVLDFSSIIAGVEAMHATVDRAEQMVSTVCCCECGVTSSAPGSWDEGPHRGPRSRTAEKNKYRRSVESAGSWPAVDVFGCRCSICIKQLQAGCVHVVSFVLPSVAAAADIASRHEMFAQECKVWLEKLSESQVNSDAAIKALQSR